MSKYHSLGLVIDPDINWGRGDTPKKEAKQCRKETKVSLNEHDLELYVRPDERIIFARCMKCGKETKERYIVNHWEVTGLGEKFYKEHGAFCTVSDPNHRRHLEFIFH